MKIQVFQSLLDLLAKIFGKRQASSNERQVPHQVPVRGELGLLWFEGQNKDPTVFMNGTVQCQSCQRLIPVVLRRNPAAVDRKRPWFFLFDANEVNNSRQLGHLFVGANTGPVLYYGGLHHCGTEQRVAVFFNRALLKSTDPQLKIVPQTKKQEKSEEDAPF